MSPKSRSAKKTSGSAPARGRASSAKSAKAGAGNKKKAPAKGSHPTKTSKPGSKSAGRTAKKTTGRAAKKKVPARKTPKPAASRSKAAKRAPSSKANKKAAKRPRKKARFKAKELRHYRELLLQKQRELTDAYHLSKGDSRSDLDDGTEDYIDYAVHSYAREFLLSLTELDRKQLFLVEEALERLSGGRFGSCEHCHKEIHVKRLEVAPWAKYCVPCQELDEQGVLPQYEEDAEEDEASEDAVADDAEGPDDSDAEPAAAADLDVDPEDR